MKIIYTADLHGNILQYKKLFNRANNEDIDAIIIGGDLLPKDHENRTIEAQWNFIRNELIDLLELLNKNIKVFLILGNDDFIYTIKEFKHLESLFDNIKILDSEIISLSKDIFIAGYSYVPPTPFIFKDWEKNDLKNPNNIELARFCKKEGLSSVSGKLEPLTIENNTSIEEDIEKLSKESDPKKTIYVIHAPPFNTCLDIIKNGDHVGSQAIKNFIESKQPLLTLHGHIHETIRMSGQFKEIIGKTLSISPGNHHETNEIAIIEFDITDIQNAQRIIVE